MNDSSSEEMVHINRKIRSGGKKRALEDLFESEGEKDEESEESIGSVDYDEKNSLFYEIFGTGEEYKYVLEEEEKKCVASVNETAVNMSEIDVNGVYEYALNNMRINSASLRKVVELVGRGNSIHFALLHNEVDDIGIEDGYRIVDAFDEYREFLRAKEEISKQCGSDECLENLRSIRGLKWYVSYRKNVSKKVEPFKELLSVDEYCENLRTRKMFYEPEQGSEFRICDSEEEIVRELSLHPVFRDVLYVLYKEYGTDDGNGGLLVDDATMFENVIRFYLNEIAMANDAWNEYREKIVRDAICKVICSGFISQVVKERNEEEMRREVFVEVVDRIVNGSVGVGDGESYICGVTEERKYLKAAMLDFRGDVVEFVTLKEEEENKLVEFVGRFNPYCVAVSGFTPGIRYLMKMLSAWNPVFVENKIASMEGGDGHVLCCNIARLVQCPEIEYGNLVHKEVIYVQKALARKELIETIRRGVLTAVSVVGIDVNYLMNSNRRMGLVSLIGMSETLVNSLVVHGNVEKLEELRGMCEGDTEYENVATYFRLFAGIDVLDSTSVHPKNYDMARLLCSRICGGDEGNVSGSVENVLNGDKAMLREYGVKHEVKDGLAESIYRTLVSGDRPVYSGLPDHLVFTEIIGDLDLVGKVVEGKVVKCKDTFYLLSLGESSATVYVRKTDGMSPDLFLNQLVSVRISGVNDFLLSYTGSVVTQSRQTTRYPRFTAHPLFKNLNSTEAEEYLRENSLHLILRMSGRDGSPIIVIRILDDVYVHMKVQESDKYYYKRHSYDDLDEFISKVAKKVVANVRNIKSHKYYFHDEKSIQEYLRQGGNYIRYGFYFSRRYPGKLCMLYRSVRECKEYIDVCESLVHEGKEFKDLDDFMKYRKSI